MVTAEVLAPKQMVSIKARCRWARVCPNIVTPLVSPCVLDSPSPYPQIESSATIRAPAGMGRVSLPHCTSVLKLGTLIDVDSSAKYTWQGVTTECSTEVEVSDAL